MAEKTIEEMTEDTTRLCSFYGTARGVFIAEGYASMAEQELRHYAARWIARLQVENEKLKHEIAGLKADESEDDEFITMCSRCGKVKDQDIWIIRPGYSGAKITYTTCPECFELKKEEIKLEEEARKAHDESATGN